MVRIVEPGMTYFDDNGVPLATGSLTFEVAGAAGTPKDTFSDAILLTENANPVPLDSAGRVENTDVFGSGNYRMIVKDSAGDQVGDVYDPVAGGAGEAPVANIAALTALTKASLSDGDELDVSGFSTQGDGGEGKFFWDESSTTTADGGTVFATDEGGTGRWKRFFVEPLSLKWFGAAGTGSPANDSAALALAVAALPNGGLIEAVAGEEYYFGALAGDTIKQVITQNITIDWRGAKIVIDGNNSSAFTATTFVQFLDTPGSMINYVFDDTEYLQAGPSRGVLPILIKNTDTNTEGYTIGPCHIIRGQSFVTATATDPNNFRASGITLQGSCTGDEMYYGVNMANNGDDASGTFSINNFKRAVFVYGVENHDWTFFAETGVATSAALNIATDSTSFPVTRNIRIRGHFKALNGIMRIFGQDTGGTGVFKDIDIKVFISGIGANVALTTNIFIIGSDDGAAGFLSSGTMSLDNIKVEIVTDLVFTDPVSVRTTSVNYKRIQLPGIRYLSSSLDDFHIITGDQEIYRSVHEDTTTAQLDIDSAYIVAGGVTTNVRWRLDLTAQQDTAFGSGFVSMASYDIIGFVSSGSVLTVQAATQLHQTTQGGSAPTFTIGASGSLLTITVSGFASDSGGAISGRLRPLQW